MTRTRPLALALLLALFVSAPSFAQDATSAYELFSWEGRRGHVFALMPAAPEPMHVDVTRAGGGLKTLLAKLGELPAGSKIAWLSKAQLVKRWGLGGSSFSMPGESERAAIREACAKGKLALAGGARTSVIFFIGDGMGMSQLTLGRLGSQALGKPYNFDRFKQLGLASTRSSSHVVTDSAASATALAAGIKTYNKAIGLDDKKRPVETVLEVAHQEGLATGLVTTTRITHATPACFVAKVDLRSKEREIAAQMAAKGYPEVLIGGGARNFSAKHLEAFKANGFPVVTTLEAMEASKGKKLVALLAGSHLPYAIDKGSILPKITKKAVDLLAAQGPFFLMVEGGRVDHAAHQHDAASCMRDQLDLDAAVGWALDFAEERGDVLVVVTADHATGNLGISENAKIKDMLAAKASSTQLAKDAKGDLGKLSELVKATHGITLSEAELALIAKFPKDRYWGQTSLGHVLSHRYGVEFYDPVLQKQELTNTHGHDGAAVGVFAYGPNAGSFRGVYENVEIPKKIAAAMGLPALRGAVAK